MEERMDGIGYIDNLIENQRKRIAGLEKELETAKSELDALLKTRSIILKSRRDQNAKPLRDRFSSFSEFLRTFLDEENMSQSDFASLLGLSPHALSNWLGGVTPRKRNIAQMTNAICQLRPQWQMQEVLDLLNGFFVEATRT